MKKAKAPAFMFYVPEWLGSPFVRMLRHDERGAYIDLLAVSWDCHGIPDDDATVAHLLGLDANSKTFRRIWDRLRPKFYLQDGKWFNARLEREREKQQAHSKKQSARANKRWKRNATASAGSMRQVAMLSTSTYVEDKAPPRSPTPAEGRGASAARGGEPKLALDVVQSVMSELKGQLQ